MYPRIAPGNALNRLHTPTGVTFDPDGNMIVSDSGNYRLMRWRRDSLQGVCSGVHSSSCRNPTPGEILIADSRPSAHKLKYKKCDAVPQNIPNIPQMRHVSLKMTRLEAENGGDGRCRAGICGCASTGSGTCLRSTCVSRGCSAGRNGSCTSALASRKQGMPRAYPLGMPLGQPPPMIIPSRTGAIWP
jgi:hypothetical protein